MFSDKEVRPTPYTIQTLFAPDRATAMPWVNTFLAHGLNQNQDSIYVTSTSALHTEHETCHPHTEIIAAATLEDRHTTLARRLRQDLSEKHLVYDIDACTTPHATELRTMYRLLAKAITVRSTILLFTASQDQRLRDALTQLSDEVTEVMHENSHGFARLRDPTNTELAEWQPYDLRQGRVCLL